MVLSRTFTRFFDSEKAGSIVLVMGTLAALTIVNSGIPALAAGYRDFWHTGFLSLSFEHWVNDALMAIFFLLVGLELERELYTGELSDIRNALLPIVAAAGGIAVPAAIHFAFNANTPTANGFGIPMATDIAFALGVLALLGSRVPASLKIFLTALAVMDDLGAIILIALFYSGGVATGYLLAAFAVFGLLLLLNLKFRVMLLTPYLLGGAAMWFLMYRSGIHATIAGVLLAFAIPFRAGAEDEHSPSHRLEHVLHRPVAFVILPLFALANTGIAIDGNWLTDLASANSLGIMLGLVLGKPFGIVLACLAAVAIGLCRLPADIGWRHIIGAGCLGGIGFTMSIFITNLAFAGNAEIINASKMAILAASLLAGGLGFLWLRFLTGTPGVE